LHSLQDVLASLLSRPIAAAKRLLRLLSQEDAHAMSLDVGTDGKTGFFAVFDGHGGKEVAKFVALKMVSRRVSLPSPKGLCSACSVVWSFYAEAKELVHIDRRPQQ